MTRRVVVIGGGVDELVAAHYLARAGHDVALVRNREHPADESLVAGWVPPRIVSDLGLEALGFGVRRADPWAIAEPGDAGLALSADVAASAAALRRLSPRDAQAWPEFCRRMHALATLLAAIYTAPPPEPLAPTRSGLFALAATGVRVRRAGREAVNDLLRLLPMPAADFLDDWFESDLLKGVLGAAAVRHLRQGPRSGGTAFNLLHHHVGSPPGVFAPPLSNIGAVLAQRRGVRVQTGTVSRIDVRGGRARAVVLENGDELAADVIVSGESPRRTLVEFADAGWLDPRLVRSVQNIRSRGAAARVSLTLDREPGFTRLVVAPSLDHVERAYDDVKYGEISRAPCVEATSLGAIAPQRYQVELHVQYVPHALRGGNWDAAQADKLADAAIACVTQRVAGFGDGVVEQRVTTPDDLEHLHGCPEGQPYHAELGLDQVLWMRPVPELAQYRTPIEGLYLCGPAMHPGGGIAGAAGANAASVVLRHLRQRA